MAAALREAEADVLVSYLPVGSEQAQRHYAQACLDAGVAFVNAIPVFIACDPAWARKFRDAGSPSSVTTSRARSAPRSCTGSSPAF